jgi:hypothetical protein
MLQHCSTVALVHCGSTVAVVHGFRSNVTVVHCFRKLQNCSTVAVGERERERKRARRTEREEKGGEGVGGGKGGGGGGASYRRVFTANLNGGEKKNLSICIQKKNLSGG